MKAYVINLASASARLDHMRRTLTGLGIEFERFDALDPDRAREHPCFSHIIPMKHRRWIRGEIACLLSHFEVWRLIAEGSDDFGMILEDDLIVDTRLKKIFDGASGLPGDADLVKLETGGYFPVFLSRRAVSTPGGPEYRRLLSGHYGSGAYLLSRRSAQILLRCTELFDMPIDNMLFFPEHAIGRKLRNYQCIPGLAIQNVDRAPHLRVAELGLGMDELRAAERERSLNAVEPLGSFSQRLRYHWLKLSALRMVVPFGSAKDS